MTNLNLTMKYLTKVNPRNKRPTSLSKAQTKMIHPVPNFQHNLPAKSPLMIRYHRWPSSTKLSRRSKNLTIIKIPNQRCLKEGKEFARTLKDWTQSESVNFLLEDSKKETESSRKSLWMTLMKFTVANVARTTCRIWEFIVTSRQFISKRISINFSSSIHSETIKMERPSRQS